MLMSYRQYAKHRGVSEGAVRKALLAGRITKDASGKIDPQKADAQWAANTDPAKKRTITDNKKRVPRAAVNAVDETLDDARFVQPAAHGVTPEDAYQRAKTANEILKAKIGQIELQVLNGELVERTSAEADIFRAARTERDAWLNWPARVSAEWAAQLGVDEHAFYLAFTAEVRKHLFTLAGQSPDATL